MRPFPIQTIARRLAPVLLLFAFAFGSTGCLREIAGEKDADPRIKVWVSIPPQTWFVEQIGGDDVKIDVMVPPGVAPEAFRPDRALKERLAHADLVYGIGVPFEEALFAEMETAMSWVGVVDTRAIMAYDPGRTRPEMHLDDPHLWMDPVKMIEFAMLGYQGLSSELPRKTLQFRDTALSIESLLKEIHADLQKRFVPYAGRAFYINHASLGHFARRYALRQIEVPDPATPSDEAEFARLVERARADRIGAVFVQPGFGRQTASALAEALGVPLVEIDVLAADYPDNLERVAAALETSFAGI